MKYQFLVISDYGTYREYMSLGGAVLDALGKAVVQKSVSFSPIPTINGGPNYKFFHNSAHFHLQV